MSIFMEWYTSRARRNRSMLCVGLDPTPEQIPPCYGDLNATTVGRWITDIIDIAASKCGCVKPQWAFYHAFGEWGYGLITDVIAYAHLQGIPVIEDAKVSDIGSTMEAYGHGIFEHHGADAVTFVPYLGSTFLNENKEHELWGPYFKAGYGVIPMILTSNPEADQIQLMALPDGRPLYLYTAELVARWSQLVNEVSGGKGMVGGVVGATYPEQAQQIRQIVGPDLPFLVPGMGAQGGTGETAVAGMPDTGKPMLIINSSRAIMGAWRDKDTGEPKDGDPLEHIEVAIDRHNQQINDALATKFGNLDLVYG